MSINNKLMPVPFASKAGDTYKFEIPLSNTELLPGRACYETGFPPRNMIPEEAGGINPYGEDFNGILNDITTAIRYTQSGNFQVYDSAFATSIGGYAINAVISGSDGNFYQATKDNVTTNPVNDKSNWKLLLDFLPKTGGTATGGITAPTLTATNSATIGGVAVTGLDNNLYVAGEQLLDTITGFKRLIYTNSTAVVRYIKLAEGEITIGGKGNITLLVGGAGSYESQQSSTTLLDFSTRNSAYLRVTHLTTTNGGQPTYGYISKKDGTCELWAKLAGYQNPLSVTELSSNRSGSLTRVSMVDAIESTTTEPNGIVYVEPILQITTANISSYQSGLGYNQAWQDVKSSRQAKVKYTNETGRSIEVAISKSGDNGEVGYLYIDNVLVGTNTSGSGAQQVSATVPNNSVYYYTSQNIEVWAELR